MPAKPPPWPKVGKPTRLYYPTYLAPWMRRPLVPVQDVITRAWKNGPVRTFARFWLN